MLGMETEVGQPPVSNMYCSRMVNAELEDDTPHSTLGGSSLRHARGVHWVVAPLRPLGLQLPLPNYLLSPAEMQ
jgi:hypothetical protein